MVAVSGVERAKEAVTVAERIVVFTGAGISTDSGIPDFRSPGTGIWHKVKPIEFQDFLASDEMRQLSWSRRFDGDREMEKAEPNTGHHAIARLVELGKTPAVITGKPVRLGGSRGRDDHRDARASRSELGLRRKYRRPWVAPPRSLARFGEWW